MELYFWLTLAKIGVFFDVISLFCLIPMLVFIISLALEENRCERKRIQKTWIKVIVFTLIVSIPAIVIPSKNELAIMWGWDAIKSDSVQEIIDKLKDSV